VLPDRRSLLLAGLAAVVAGCASAARTGSRGAPTTTAAGAAGTPSRAAAGSAEPPRTTATAGSTTRARPGAPAVEVVRGPGTRPEVALTFHGAGEPGLSLALLRAAEAGHAAITVFAVGTWLDATPSLARRVLQGGHELANHTQHHLQDLKDQPESVAEDEFARVAATLRRLTGSPGAFARPSAMDHATPTVLAAAGRAGYTTSLSFDVDPADYRDPGSDLVVARTLAGVRPGSIVSLHLGHQGTVTALPRILAGLADKGLTPVTASRLLQA